MTFPRGTHDLWLRYWLKAWTAKPTEPARRVIPRPRNRVNVLDSPQFRAIQERLLNLLALEGERAA